jgi:hypothetical protein
MTPRNSAPSIASPWSPVSRSSRACTALCESKEASSLTCACHE